ncbi:MAG: EamA family transporter RarD [Hyphomicrobiales bacterium]
MQGLTEQQRGVLYNVIAHLFWGAMAAYFGIMRHIPAPEIAVHRGLWSVPLALVIVFWLGQWSEVLAIFRQPRTLAILTLTGAIIVFNWGFYIWSIEVGRTLESSLGYFINPLLNIVAGYFFLGERFNRAQLVAIALATLAVLVQTIATGVFPWLGLALGSSFCLYGLIRKQVHVGPTQGFLVEVLVIAVPLLLAEIWMMKQGWAHFGANLKDTLLLAGCGAWTTGALVFFAASLKRIRYSTAGILQFLSPSLVFLTAVFVFGEEIGGWKLVSFIMLWVALAIYSIAAIRESDKMLVNQVICANFASQTIPSARTLR